MVLPVSLVDAGGPALLLHASVLDGPLHSHVLQVPLHAVPLGALARRETLVHLEELDWVAAALLRYLLQSCLVETVGHFVSADSDGERDEAIGCMFLSPVSGVDREVP